MKTTRQIANEQQQNPTKWDATSLPSVEDYKRSFNCLFIWWINGMAFGLGIITIMKIFSLWTM